MGHIYHGELLVITRGYLKSPPSEFEGPKKQTATSFSTNICHTRGRYSRHLLALWSRHLQIFFLRALQIFLLEIGLNLILSQMLHVSHIYLHLVDFWGKCR